MAKPDRTAILDRYRAMIRQGTPIIGGGAGTGLSGKAQVMGAVDFTKYIVCVQSEYARGGIDQTRGAVKSAEFHVGLV